MTPRPQALKVIRDNIPKELQSFNQWLNWKYKWKDDGWTKPPVSPHTGQISAATDPASWSDLDTAMEMYTMNDFAGIGFALSKKDSFTIFDFDHCKCRNTGKIYPEIKKYIDRLDSYWELSPSDTGVRLIVKAKKPGNRCKKVVMIGDKKFVIEIYDSERYLTITGNKRNGSPSNVEDRQAEVDAIYDELFGPDTTSPQRQPTQGNFDAERYNLCDSDYFDIIRESKTPTKFFKLFKADWSFSPSWSHSHADSSFCFILAFYTKDPWRIDKIFRLSRLMRSKWDSPRGKSTYGKNTVAKALSMVKGHYLPLAEPNYTPEFAEVLSAYRRNEVGDAELYIKLNKDRYRYDDTEKRWYSWHTHYWKKDRRGCSLHDVEQVCKMYESHVDSNENFRKRIISLRSAHRKNNVLKLASIGPSGLGITGDEWDLHPRLLPVANGVVSLEDGSILPGTQAQYLRTYCDTPYDPNVGPPVKLLKSFDEMFSGNQNLIEYMQRLLGYGLLGEVTEHLLVIFYGPNGFNGKGTIIRTISKILGPFTISFGSGLLTTQSFTNDPKAPDAATLALRGKRFVFTSETSPGQRFNSTRVKRLTGGNRLAARGVNAKDIVEFDPSHLLILETNHNPKVSFKEKAFWNRMHVVPFNVSFLEDPDPNNPNEKKRVLKKENELLTESKEILKWMVDGAVEYLKHGTLAKPNEVTEETNNYRKKQDSVGMFAEKCLIKGGKTYSTPLFEAYVNWCKDEGYKRETHTKFGIRMKDIAEKGEVFTEYDRDNSGSWYGVEVTGVTGQCLYLYIYFFFKEKNTPTRQPVTLLPVTVCNHLM